MVTLKLLAHILLVKSVGKSFFKVPIKNGFKKLKIENAFEQRYCVPVV